MVTNSVTNENYRAVHFPRYNAPARVQLSEYQEAQSLLAYKTSPDYLFDPAERAWLIGRGLWSFALRNIAESKEELVRGAKIGDAFVFHETREGSAFWYQAQDLMKEQL